MMDFPKSTTPTAHNKQVPLRSPLVLPGGKTWFIPHIRRWLSETCPTVIIEPFAGGAVTSITALAESLAIFAVLVERDRDIAAFWHAVLESGPELRQMIGTFEPTLERAHELENSSPLSTVELAFRTFVLSRVRFSNGVGRTHGFSSRALGRWERALPKLLGRIESVEKYARRVFLAEGDALKLLPHLLPSRRDIAVFVDPPYVIAGKQLYKHYKIDNKALFRILRDWGGNFLMTQDASPEIVELIRRFEFSAVFVEMNSQRNKMRKELVITREPMFAN